MPYLCMNHTPSPEGHHNEDSMKGAYAAPSLAIQGDTVAATRDTNTVPSETTARPDMKMPIAVGSVGFGL